MALRLGRVLITIVALVTGLGPYLADWNETHIYNPTWPPHAKFHNGQTMTTGPFLSIMTLYYLWRQPLLKSSNESKDHAPSARDRKVVDRSNLNLVVLLASVYWITQGSAYFYPGAAGVDEPDKDFAYAQAYLEAVILSLLGLGWWLERRFIDGRP